MTGRDGDDIPFQGHPMSRNSPSAGPQGVTTGVHVTLANFKFT